MPNPNIINKLASNNNSEDVKISPEKIKSFKAYPFIISIMAVLQISTILYSRYFIDVFNMKLSLGPLLFTPAILYIFQIVAEVYGWQYGRQIVWINLCINILFTIITVAVQFVPISSFTHLGLHDAYIHLMGSVWVTSLGFSVVLFIADYISTLFTAKSHKYFRGTKVLLRLVIVHFITELLLLSWSFLQMPYNGYTLDQTYTAMGQMFVARMVTSSGLALLSLGVIWWIQNYVDRVVCFDMSPTWELFHWEINEKIIVKIKTKDWKALPNKVKKNINLTKLLDTQTE